MNYEQQLKEDERIIKQVQKDYPENSKEALQFAINLARLSENDLWVDRLRAMQTKLAKEQIQALK